MELSYFPGCSLATSAKENNWSLLEICKKIGLKLDEYYGQWGRPFDPALKIIHFFELLDQIKLSGFCGKENHVLNGLRFVPYYGCMLTRPPSMRRGKNYYGLMENVLSSVGASPVRWSCASRCCGTFLSAAKPDFVTELVNNIVRDANNAHAECIVTACAMCHLNLEIRCNIEERIPVFHFSELLSLALGSGFPKGWSSRHIVDPMPILKERGLIPSAKEKGRPQ